MEVKYDKTGRMLYNAEFHSKHGSIWSKEDLQYLIDWYGKVGAEEMSFALERPITAINMKIQRLRQLGKISKKRSFYNKRINSMDRRI